LVDQLEQIYSYEPKGDSLKQKEAEEFKEDRKCFIKNLLYAANDREKQISIIATLRSDFLEESEDDVELNELIVRGEQSLLIGVMSDKDLHKAVTKPAKLAKHELDLGTVNLLIEQTRGRKGGLPLLEVALEQIWEGLRKEKTPAETLRKIKGVGGALANKAEEIYSQLDPDQQKIARRIFVGLLQLGETKDIGRRIAVSSLISYRDKPEQVTKLIKRFAEVRLITLATDITNGSEETAEVAHEALFEHWDALKGWIQERRNYLPFERRLDESAKYWQKHHYDKGLLWGEIDINQLRLYEKDFKDDMTHLQENFIRSSKENEETKK
jgi:hypothetical protein